jgi:hypothetical protein
VSVRGYQVQAHFEAVPAGSPTANESGNPTCATAGATVPPPHTALVTVSAEDRSIWPALPRCERRVRPARALPEAEVRGVNPPRLRIDALEKLLGWLMLGVARQLLTSIAAALLALPPGWCCHLPHAAAAPPAKAASSCCTRHGPRAPSVPPGRGGDVPEKVCCCPADAGLPPAPETPAPPPDLPALTLLDAADLTPSLSLEDGWPPAFWSHVVSPPLHVLHCLWLC